MLRLLFPPSLGRVPASARAELLGQWFTRNLGVPIDIQVASSYEELRRTIEHREVDLAWAPPSVCAAVQGVAHTILKAVRAGHSSYLSAIVGRSGELDGLEILRGRSAAWVDRLSTAGYLLPIAHLRASGHDPDSLLAEQLFVGSYARALRAVLDREADIAAVYVRAATNEAAHDSAHELVSEADRLEAIAFTAEVPSDGLVVVERSEHTDTQHVVERLRSLTDGRTHTMLLTIFDAEALVPAVRGEYDALLHAVD